MKRIADDKYIYRTPYTKYFWFGLTEYILNITEFAHLELFWSQLSTSESVGGVWITLAPHLECARMPPSRLA
jgi:hypothetical protein